MILQKGLKTFPNDLWVLLAQTLDPPTLVSFIHVCHRFRTLCRDLEKVPKQKFCISCASYGYIRLLKWARGVDCSWEDGGVCEAAATAGFAYIIAYARLVPSSRIYQMKPK